MLENEEIKNIAMQSGYEEISQDEHLLYLSKAERWNAIHNYGDSKVGKVAAAIEVQRNWRGYMVRSNLQSNINGNESISYSYDRSSILGSSYAHDSVDLVAENNIPQDQSILGLKYAQDSSVDLDAGNNIPQQFKEFCCLIIQRWWRSVLSKRRRKVYIGETDRREFNLQSSCDTVLFQTSNPHVTFDMEWSDTDPNEVEMAVTIIQRSWRRHVDMEVFKYYKDFISFKCDGNPAEMLKCINPNESHLLDSASGLLVRFRLGGESFPPNVYYKIFTNRNITDVGAFAPRDYAKSRLKIAPMKVVDKDVDAACAEDKSGWYERWENNGWRIISHKMIGHFYQDSVSYPSSIKKNPFHYSKLVRKDDLNRKKKRKKIEWMKRMYRDGAANSEDGNVQSLLDSTAKGIIEASQTGFAVSVEDWEVDELLMWTNTLNFDQYISDWKEVGTTLSTNIAGVILGHILLTLIDNRN